MTLKAALIALTVLAVPAAASAVTVADVVALSKAGVPDVVLTALIDADRTIFTLGAEQILALRDAGVSDAVVLKMIGSRKEFEPPLPPVIEATAPPPIAAEGDPPLPTVTTIAVPYFVPVPIFVDTRAADHHSRRRVHHHDASINTNKDDDRSEHADKDGRSRKRALPPGTIRNGEFVGR